jgi:hypothetical protein
MGLLCAVGVVLPATTVLVAQPVQLVVSILDPHTSCPQVGPIGVDSQYAKSTSCSPWSQYLLYR